MRFDLAQAQQVFPPKIDFKDGHPQPSNAGTFHIDTSSEEETSGRLQPSAPTSLLNPRDMMLLQRRDVSIEQRADYEHMLSEFTAANNQGQDPVDFLRNLSKEGLDLLTKVHSFPAGMRVNIESMSKEEAINFIVPDSAQVDLNNDGLIGSANGSKSFRFPPVNAPQDVKDAWNEAMDGLPEKDQLLAQGMFMVLHVQANITYDTAGNPVGIREPGDPEYRNPFAAQNFSYSDMVDKMLDQLEAYKSYDSPERYEWKKDILTRFGDALGSKGTS